MIQKTIDSYDIIMVGTGIMSATLATLLHELDPKLHIALFERLPAAGNESSQVLNNAGTGHSAFCELNYTLRQPDGHIDIQKAISIAESFEISKQFWSYLVTQWYIINPQDVINTVPHCSVVFDDDIVFLKDRYEALQTSHLFDGMEYTQDSDMIHKRMPLVTQWRDMQKPIAATFMHLGTDVNFWALTKKMIDKISHNPMIDIFFSHEVVSLYQQKDKTRMLTVHDKWNNKKNIYQTKFLFVWWGWWSLRLLQKSWIQEIKGYGWFPISWKRLICTNPAIVQQHAVKVYGKADIWSPPMSTPHLDTRIVNWKNFLLFGPYAGFTTKFLIHGSRSDLFRSLSFDNIYYLLSAGRNNIPLTLYLIKEAIQTHKQRLQSLIKYMPDAQEKDWKLVQAGYRVQVIKWDKKKWWVLEFGTEVIISKDKTISWLLWASPGASTSVQIMLEIVEHCFPHYIQNKKDILHTMIPSYGQSLKDDAILTKKIRTQTNRILHLASE